jgi:plasmid segregation protein ParM
MLKVTDVGYSHSKGVDPSGKRIIIESVWGEVQRTDYSRDNLETNGHATQIGTEKGEWFLGQAALEQSRFVTRRQDPDWITTPEYLALHLYLLSEMTQATQASIDLVTGLPVGDFGSQGKLKSILQGTHKITRPNRKAQQITINKVICLPQGLAAVFSEALDDNGKIKPGPIADGMIGLIDIGGRTINVSTFKELRAIPTQTLSIDAGMWSVLSEVEKRINAAYPGQNLHGHETIGVLQSGSIKRRGIPQDVNGIIYDVVSSFARKILGEASQVWGSAVRLDMLLICGGGAEAIAPVIIEQHPQAKMINNPQWANAAGYLKFGKRVE